MPRAPKNNRTQEDVVAAGAQPEIAIRPLSLATNLPALHGYLPRPRDVAQQLQEELNGRGHTLKIDWNWAGRNREGVVNIFNRAGVCVYCATYARAQTRWGGCDELISSCNRGSSKHLALIAALAFMRSLPHRHCEGITASLVS
jgi:hypothetical protein